MPDSNFEANYFLEKAVYWQIIAMHLAGYFHETGVDMGLPIKYPGDLVAWAAQKLNMTEP